MQEGKDRAPAQPEVMSPAAAKLFWFFARARDCLSVLCKVDRPASHFPVLSSSSERCLESLVHLEVREEEDNPSGGQFF